MSNCGKTSFDTFEQAQKVVNSFSKKGRAYGKSQRRMATKKPKRVYKCPYCGNYHLTSKK
jgi:hypothetical protein